MRRLTALAATLLMLVVRPPAGDLAAHGERVVPPPEECRVAPRPFPAVAAAFGETPPPATGPAGSADPAPFIVPAGQPPGDGTWSGIVATLQELLACENAGDALRAFALYSDAFLPWLLARQAPDRARLDALSLPPTPVPEAQRAALLAVEDVRLLADGRVGAIVHVDRPRDPRPEEVAYVFFVKDGDRWVVDGIVEPPAGAKPLTASATLRNAAGAQVGVATLTQEFGGRVRGVVTLDGLPPGGHAVHVHETGACDAAGAEPFSSAGGHFDPAGAAHPNHAGDLGNAGTDVTGRGEFYVGSDRFTLSPGPASLLDADGSAIVLHAGMDDGSTAPEGNSGARLACGVIVLGAPSAPASGGAADGGVPTPTLAMAALVAAGGGLLAWLAWGSRRHRARPRPAANGRTRRGGGQRPAGERLVRTPSAGTGGKGRTGRGNRDRGAGAARRRKS